MSGDGWRAAPESVGIRGVRSHDEGIEIETEDGHHAAIRTPARIPEGGFRSFRSSFRRMIAATLRGRCPDCGRASMFAGPFRIREVCSECGVRFERDSGSFLGPTTLAYVVAVGVEAVLFGVLVWRFGLFPGLEYILIAGAMVAVIGSYRFLKGWWIWLLWRSELVYPDPPSGKEAS